MKILGVLVFLVIAITLCTCKVNGGSNAGGPTASQNPKPGTSAPDNASEPIACKSDADCPPRPCGPCKPGEIIRVSGIAVACYRNPCTNARSVCGAQGWCVVHPDTRFVEDVHSQECQKLLRDKWGVLCKGKDGSALMKCQNIIDAATAHDDNDGCKAARTRL